MSEKNKWDATNIPDLSGQTWLVTGATNGLGLETARRAAASGARLVLAVRDTARGAEIARELSGAEVVALDLASLDSVRRAAAQIDDVDVLINNAGGSPTQRLETADGFEMNLGVNFLGPFLFTNLVLPKVRRRVVVLGSTAHKGQSFDFGDPHFRTRAWSKSTAYAQSKLADMVWGLELARRLREADRGVDAHLAHPGWAATNMANPGGSRWTKVLLAPVVSLMAQPAERAALPTLFAATQPLEPGSYIGPDGPGEMRGYPKVVQPSRTAADPEVGKRMWEFAVEETGSPR